MKKTALKYACLCTFAFFLFHTGHALADDPFAGANSSLAVSSSEAATRGLATVDLSTGSLRTSYSFDLLAARGAVQPSLSLSYDSGAGIGWGGYGWDLDVPSIVRMHPSGGRGIPTYVDPPNPNADRFYFGSTALVPICRVGSCSLDERFADGVNGWFYFRAEVESEFARYFWSPDGRSWRIEYKSGETIELGVSDTYDGTEYDETGLLRWNIVRRYDVHGRKNEVVYVWSEVDHSRYDSDHYLTRRYLTDIYDTPDERGYFAHHTTLSYTFPTSHYPQNRSRLWHQTPDRVLSDVLIAGAADPSGLLTFARRYRLSYNSDWLLSTIELEGQCPAPIAERDAMVGTNCPRQLPTRFSYSGPAGASSIQTAVADGLDPVTYSPVLADLNADGFADIVQPAPSRQFAWLNAPTTFNKIRLDVFPGLLGAASDTFLAKDKSDLVFFGDFASNGRVSALWKDAGSQSFALYSAFVSGSSGMWFGGMQTGQLPTNINRTQYHTPSFADLDSDGIVDLYTVNHNWLSVRNPDGTVTPFSKGVWHDEGMGFSSDARSFIDVNGDGNADIVTQITQSSSQVIVKGFFGFGDPSHTGFDFPDYPFFEFAFGFPNEAGFNLSNMSLGDVTGDGIVDAVFLTDNGLVVFRSGIAAPDRIQTPTGCLLRLADMNGKGSDDIVLLCSDSVTWVYYDSGTPSRLLTRITRAGLSTDIEYKSTSEIARVNVLRGYSQKTTPQSSYAVTRVTTRNALPIPKQEIHSTRYWYENPVYDGLERVFRGFQDITVTPEGESAAESRTHYLIGDCQEDLGVQCAVANDHPAAALRGLPVLVEVRETNRQTYSATRHISYRINSLYQGTDGRRVRQVYPEDVNTYLYDTSNFQPSSQTVYLTEVDSTDTAIHSTTNVPVVLQAAPVEHLQSTAAYDMLGNSIESVDYGRVGQDDEIHTTASWSVYGSSSWLWRMTATETKSPTVLGHRSTEYSYNAFGELTETRALLEGALALQRRHESGKTTAPAPVPRTGMFRAASYVYDEWGNMVLSAGADNQCEESTYDIAFHQFPTSSTQYVGNPTNTRWGQTCGDNPLTTYLGFDTLIQKQNLIWNFNDKHDWIEFDGFGRAVSFSAFDTRVEYLPRAETDPAQIVHTTSSAGESWKYIDDFGRTVLSLKKADTSAGDGGAWIARGLPDRDFIGRIVRGYEPGFYSGSPSAYPLSVAPSSSFSSVLYDDFGRISSSRTLDGTEIARLQYRGLLTDSYNERQLSKGLPPTTTQVDGHGRTVQTIERFGAAIGEPGSGETIFLDLKYLATGEIAKLDKYHAFGSDHYIREMLYDSHGNLVRNIEPNTSAQTFDPITGGPITYSWTYAYNTSGALIGTSDARGCGKNLSYDAGGRTLGEDYSPCLNSQALYSSAPESWNVYDATEAGETSDDVDLTHPEFLVGRLVASYDRGSHNRYAYDIEGRQTRFSRQIATPDGSGYAPHWFRMSTAFDTAGRVASETTGADVPELMPGGSSSVTTRYSGRGIPSSVDGSYGHLLGANVVEADGFTTYQSYGDLNATVAQNTADSRRRLSTASVQRLIPAHNAETLQEVLADYRFDYDQGVLVGIADGRGVNEWQDGFKPVSRRMDHDDVGRLRGVNYTYTTPGGLPDGDRVQFQEFGYDWQGNLTKSDDDAHRADRSFGTAQVSTNRLTRATGIAAGYDASGNISYLSTNSTIYFYDWDELGRLSRARVYQAGALAQDESFLYDRTDSRVLSNPIDNLVNVEVFPSLRLDHAVFDGTDYERTPYTEHVYLAAGQARLQYAPDLPGTNPLHVFFEISDHLGSTSIVIDKETGELVERTTALAYGGAESDYSPARWKSFHEIYGFSGKENDSNIGLTYFGARYYIPILGRWASADPLTIHGLGADINPYAYVHGSPLTLTDPIGLDCPPGSDTGISSIRIKNCSNELTPTPEGDPEPGGPSGGEVVRSNGEDGPSRRKIIPPAPLPRADLNVVARTVSPAESYGRHVWNVGLRQGMEASVGNALGPWSLVPGLKSAIAQRLIPDALLFDTSNSAYGAETAAKGSWMGVEMVALGGIGAAPALGERAAAVALEEGAAYTVAFEVRLTTLEYGLSRANHFKISNTYLEMARAEVPSLAEQIPAPTIMTRAPADWVWHHATFLQGGGPGLMQLVPKVEHTGGSLFWRLLHPGYRCIGGYSQWCIPAGAPKN